MRCLFRSLVLVLAFLVPGDGRLRILEGRRRPSSCRKGSPLFGGSGFNHLSILCCPPVVRNGQAEVIGSLIADHYYLEGHRDEIRAS